VTDWVLKKIELSGGFLAGLELELHDGLTCIIGPRGSGKSTLAEAIRFGLLGAVNAGKQRTDLLQANIRGSMLTVHATKGLDQFILRRQYPQAATITNLHGKPLLDVDADRGTFLPLDAYGSSDIELIADETLGERRRSLLDDLIESELREIQLELNDLRRSLEANADQQKSVLRELAEHIEQIEEIGDARGRLAELPKLDPSEETGALLQVGSQQQFNSRETRALTKSTDLVREFERSAKLSVERLSQQILEVEIPDQSKNDKLTSGVPSLLSGLQETAKKQLSALLSEIDETLSGLQAISLKLIDSHAAQQVEYNQLQAKHQLASEAVRERTTREQSVLQLSQLEVARKGLDGKVVDLQGKRDLLKAEFLLKREQVSRSRSEVAKTLQSLAGEKVRVRVLQNADDLNYRQLLTEGLRGAGVRNHEDILSQLMHMRPEHLSQLVRQNDFAEFDGHTSLGIERSGKIIDAFRRNLDMFELELTAIDDQVKLELNVSTTKEELFKDAAELSKGQKCTAILPLLLARRSTPLIIDQPEDNLDNHFIYETVVDAISRLKQRRQMLFITHNANIPVLGGADLVVVMNSDGKRGFIEKTGTLDECRAEIIDLLEGGEEAFELRRKRYAGE
jgi:energy-coupling factor transporter ATP-binding protein EcfA2